MPSSRLRPPLLSVDRSRGLWSDGSICSFLITEATQQQQQQDKSPEAAILTLSQGPWGKQGHTQMEPPAPPTGHSPGAPHLRAQTPWRPVAAPPRLTTQS